MLYHFYHLVTAATLKSNSITQCDDNSSCEQAQQETSVLQKYSSYTEFFCHLSSSHSRRNGSSRVMTPDVFLMLRRSIVSGSTVSYQCDTNRSLYSLSLRCAVLRIFLDSHPVLAKVDSLQLMPSPHCRSNEINPQHPLRCFFIMHQCKLVSRICLQITHQGPPLSSPCSLPSDLATAFVFRYGF